MKSGSYKVCQKCLGRIVKGGVSVHRKIGNGYLSKGQIFHRHCWKEVQSQFNRSIPLSCFTRLREMMGYKI